MPPSTQDAITPPSDSLTVEHVMPPAKGFRQWIGAVMRYRSDHPASARILDTLDRLLDRPYRTNALLTGEPGTGKEGLAKAIHAAMHENADAPFVELATRGRSDADLVRELFGDATRPGAVESAKGGTLYLDEIAELSSEMQARLAELVRGRYQRVGELDTRHVELCVIAGTDHPNVRALVQVGKLRHDLFHRLARLELVVPPLRERPADVSRAAIWIGNRIFSRHGEPRKLVLAGEAERGDVVVTDDAMRLFESHPWPGNFRELDLVMERALLLYLRGDALTSEILRAAMEHPDGKR